MPSRCQSSRSARLRRSIVFVIPIIGLLAACGGRQAKPVSIVNDHDALLSCDHLIAEYAVNKRKIESLREEQRLENRTASGKSAAAPFLNDFKHGEAKEIAALRHRNAAVENLMMDKNCKE